MNDQEVQQIRISNDMAKESIADAQALDRLRKNADFKRLIEQRYFKDEAIRLVRLLGDSTQQDEMTQKNINLDMQAVSRLSDFFRTVYAKADWATQAIENNDAELAAMHAEEQAGE